MTVIVGDIVEARGRNPKKAQKSSQKKVLKNNALVTEKQPSKMYIFLILILLSDNFAETKDGLDSRGAEG